MFKVVSHTADIALDIAAPQLESLFIEAAKGWRHLVLENSPAHSAELLTVEMAADEAEDLLVQWLSELNYLFTVRYWVLSDVESLTIRETEKELRLHASLGGEAFDEATHDIQFEIKAVTYHQLEINKVGNTYKTRVVFDI